MDLKWPSAIVATAVIALIGAVAVAAISRYAVTEFLQVWSSLGPILGIVTGAIVAYFFTRDSVKEIAKQAGLAATVAQHVPEKMDLVQRQDLLQNDPLVASWFRLR